MVKKKVLLKYLSFIVVFLFIGVVFVLLCDHDETHRNQLQHTSGGAGLSTSNVLRGILDLWQGKNREGQAPGWWRFFADHP